MDLSPTYFENKKRLAILQKSITSFNSALEINGYFGTGLFEVESFGFKQLVGIGSEFDDVYASYLGYQKEEILINGGKFDKKPLNRLFKSKYIFIKGDVLTYNFKEQTFDLIIHSNALQVNPNGTHKKLLTIINKLLNPEGLLDITVHTNEYSNHCKESGYTLIENNVLKDKFSGKLIYLLNRSEISEMFEETGSEILDERSKKGVHRFMLRKK